MQVGFAALCVWIGVEFHYFVKYLETGGISGSSYRPPGVEGFLPISSLMSLYHFFLTGEVHGAHPAGLFILLAVLIVSFVFGKSFCSWICPISFLSEILGDLGDRLFRRRIKLSRWLDYPFRSLKSLLLGFFVYSIFFLMTLAALSAFLDSPHNLVSDIKMCYFFADIPRLTLIIILSLFLMSIVIRNSWCRYLCPYGALLGILSLLSPHKIRRNAANCIGCGERERVCPSFIKVDRADTVVFEECTSCLKCVDACPEAQTLEFKPIMTRRTVSKKVVTLGIVAMFVFIVGLGMATSNWQNRIMIEEYLHH